MLDRLNHDQEKIVEYNAQQAQKEEIRTQNAQQSKHATSRKFPAVSIIRPTQIAGSGGAVATIKSFTADGLFIGQPGEFFALLHDLAEQADAARRG